jgi:hypothetical protein
MPPAEHSTVLQHAVVAPLETAAVSSDTAAATLPTAEAAARADTAPAESPARLPGTTWAATLTRPMREL